VDRGGVPETVGGFLDAEALIVRLRELGAGGAS
jgi:hypothetical protein